MLDSVRAAVEAADASTASLQEVVQHEAWIGQDKYAASQYDDPVERAAFITEGAFPRRKDNGEVITAKAQLLFLSEIPPHGAANRHEPVDPRDRFTLPSGMVGTVGEVHGVLVDPDSARPLASVVWLV